MKTLEERLQDAGQTDEQIKAIVATLGPARGVFDGALSEAERLNLDATNKLTEAQKKTTDLNKFWNDEATPQINEALSARVVAEAQANFYRTQAQEAKKAGFIAADAPGFDEHKNDDKNRNRRAEDSNGNRDRGGRFVEGEVPGSPKYLTADQGVEAISEAAYLLTEHQRLFNEPLPDLRELMTDAGQSRRKARQVWEEKYKVGDRRTAIAAELKAKERAEIEKDVTAKIAKQYADKYGNENTRPLQPSRFPNYAKDAVTGVPDKLAWTKADKRERLRSRIYEQVAKEGTPSVH